MRKIREILRLHHEQDLRPRALAAAPVSGKSSGLQVKIETRNANNLEIGLMWQLLAEAHMFWIR